MDIELSLLRGIEKEKAIPFEELVSIIEQAILTAYAKHTSPTGELPAGARSELDRKTGHVAVFIPLLDEDDVVIGEAESTPEDFGRIAGFAAKQVISQRLRDIADDAPHRVSCHLDRLLAERGMTLTELAERVGARGALRLRDQGGRLLISYMERVLHAERERRLAPLDSLDVRAEPQAELIAALSVLQKER